MHVVWYGNVQNQFPTDRPDSIVGKRSNSRYSFGWTFHQSRQVFDFDQKDTIPKKEIENKLEIILDKISSLKIRPQTKIKIFSRYVPSQFNFELKIYDFTSTFISSTLDSLCTRHIRKWLEFPASSCVTEWASSPIKFCGLGIPTFEHRAERSRLSKRNALMSSKNAAIREFWAASNHSNIKHVDHIIKHNDAFLKPRFPSTEYCLIFE